MLIIHKYRYRLIFWGLIVLCLAGTLSQLWPRLTGTGNSPLVINEFMASNGNILTDEDGDHSDWIELYNQSDRPLNLAHWSLTDDPTRPDQWPLPAITLGPRDYLVLFASGKDRRGTSNAWRPHTNFQLSRTGEFLGLYYLPQQRFTDIITRPGTEHRRNISYGRYHISPDEWAYHYFAHPTPGNPNLVVETDPHAPATHWVGMTEPVEFSVLHGLYTTPFTLALSTTTPGAIIRYTTDNSEPTTIYGDIYHQPLMITRTTVVRAISVKADMLSSSSATQSYIFVNDILNQPADPVNFPLTWGIHRDGVAGYITGTEVIADYEMDPAVVETYRATIKTGLTAIPSISLVMDQRSFTDLYSNPRERGVVWERPASVEFIYPDDRPGFQSNTGVRMQGGKSRREFIPKHSFRLFFKGLYGPTKLNYPLFPHSPLESFDTIILRAGMNRSYAGYPADLSEVKLSAYSRDEWLRRSQKAMSGLSSHGVFAHLYVNGLYWGVYNAVERPDNSFAAAYLEGDEAAWVSVNHEGPVHDPHNIFETLLARMLTVSTPGEKYAIIEPRLDTAQYIDYLILNWYAGTDDWPENNWYAAMPAEKGQIEFFVWDGERSWIDGAQIQFGPTTVLAWPNVIKPIFDVAIQDADFRMELADRLYKHLYNEGALTTEASQARWLELTRQLETAMAAESARWGDVRFQPPLTPADWQQARDQVWQQMVDNGNKLIALTREQGYYPPFDPPTFNQAGGTVPPNFKLTMTAPTGEIYYTTDGRDPRRQVTGKIAPSAQRYHQPLVLTTTTTFKARVLVGESWSALHDATFTVLPNDQDQPQQRLQITEIMYNPLGNNDCEFLELTNTGSQELDLANISIEGIGYTFPANTAPLAAGQRVVLVRQAAAFINRYPGVPFAGVYPGRLSNKGETLIVRDTNHRVLVSLTYDDGNGWPVSADGRGDSLVLINEASDPNEPRNWQSSANLHGSPGAAEPVWEE